MRELQDIENFEFRLFLLLLFHKICMYIAYIIKQSFSFSCRLYKHNQTSDLYNIHLYACIFNLIK